MPSDFKPRFASSLARVVELAADPEAPRWARDCAWVPGTGYCRNHSCAAKCVFRAEREAEAARVICLRRRRRRAQRAPIDRLVGLVTAFVPVCDLITVALAVA